MSLSVNKSKSIGTSALAGLKGFQSVCVDGDSRRQRAQKNATKNKVWTGPSGEVRPVKWVKGPGTLSSAVHSKTVMLHPRSHHSLLLHLLIKRNKYIFTSILYNTRFCRTRTRFGGKKHLKESAISILSQTFVSSFSFNCDNWILNKHKMQLLFSWVGTTMWKQSKAME